MLKISVGVCVLLKISVKSYSIWQLEFIFSTVMTCIVAITLSFCFFLISEYVFHVNLDDLHLLAS